MAEKRKRHSDGTPRPKNKAALDIDRSDKVDVKVTFVDINAACPVLLSSGGLQAHNIPFKAYAKPLLGRKSSSTPQPSTHDLLLYSSQHSRLHYTAEKGTSPLEQQLSHYIAVFDPATNELQIAPAHHLHLRASLRPKVDEEASQKRKTYAQQREELGREFGTKKAKQAIASRSANAITPSQSKSNAGSQKVPDVEAAILASIADVTAATPSREHAEATHLASKPIPTPNLSADTVEDVYLFDILIPPADARLVPINDWQTHARADEEIKFSHRCIAHRVDKLAKSDDEADVRKLQALAYLSLLLEFHDILQSGGRSAEKKVPKKEVMTQKLATWPRVLVDTTRRRFANESNMLSKWHLDLLYTHIVALSLFVDGWMGDLSDLRDDLKMENKLLAKYVQELGGRVSTPNESYRLRRNLTKAQAATVRIARLSLPLEFPKPRSGRRR